MKFVSGVREQWGIIWTYHKHKCRHIATPLIIWISKYGIVCRRWLNVKFAKYGVLYHTEEGTNIRQLLSGIESSVSNGVNRILRIGKSTRKFGVEAVENAVGDVWKKSSDLDTGVSSEVLSGDVEFLIDTSNHLNHSAP